MRGGENHLFPFAIGRSKLWVTPPALPSLTGSWDCRSRSLRLSTWARPSIWPRPMVAPPPASLLTGFRGCRSRSLRPSVASPLTVAGISREEPRARRRLGCPVARGAGGLSHTSASSPRAWSCGSAGLGRRVSAAHFSFPQGSGGRLSADAPQVRVPACHGRPGSARDGGGSRGCAALRVRGFRWRGGDRGSRSSFGFGVGVGGRPDGPGSLGSRERCPCLESPCAGIARFRDEGTISEDPGHLGGAEYSLARSWGHGKLRAGRGSAWHSWSKTGGCSGSGDQCLFKVALGW